MKDIRIFVASSKELLPERNALAYFALAYEDEFAKRGLRVRLSKWEYVDPTMTEARTEDRYLEEMYNCDAALVIFKTLIGKYTREEMEKALEHEKGGCSRLKAHRILFKENDGTPTAELAAWRAKLKADEYGTFVDYEGLKNEFLALVEHLVELDKSGKASLLPAAPDSHVRKITAFLAADDELAADRDAFADTVLNLNDLLELRNLRVRLQFCGPEFPKDQLQSLVSSSEMGLVLYGTNIRAFGRDEIQDAYARQTRGENPKRLYVFFRDDEGKALPEEFKEFRDSFVDKLGHFICQFGGADTLRLSFLLSLERYAGETIEIYSTVSAPTTSVFVGRENELRKLHELLTPVPGKFPAGRLPVITGAGGTGKSELVRQYASQFRVQYPGGVFQVDMEHARTWDDAFLGILKGTPNNGVRPEDYLELKVKDPNGDSHEDPLTGTKVRDALLQKSRKAGPILLVLDNVEGCMPLFGRDGGFAKAFPVGFSERVLVNVVATARVCDTMLRPDDWAESFPLGDISKDAAIELLLEDRNDVNEAERSAAAHIAELLGYRALYLKRVPALIGDLYAEVICDSYVELAKALEDNLLETVAAETEETHLPSVLWKMTCERLAKVPLGRECIKLAQVASFFSPDGFAQHILKHLWKTVVAPGLDDRKFDRAVAILKHHNVFQSIDPVRIHRLDRASILQSAKVEFGDSIEQAIADSLTDYDYVSQKTWLLLSEHLGILKRIPLRFLSGALCRMLLVQNSGYSAYCPWEKLGNHDWIWLLRRCPQFELHCPWKRMLKYDEHVSETDRMLAGNDEVSIYEWCELVADQPVFAERCPWGRLSGHDWAWLLVRRSEFANKCNWRKLSGEDWASLLNANTSFADKCPWEIWDGKAWAIFLGNHPEYASLCPWGKITGDSWGDLLAQRPEFANKCRWQEIGGAGWARLLSAQPQFEGHCDWNLLNGWNWSRLLAIRPQFADKCDWNKLYQADCNDIGVWSDLLAVQPQFADRFPGDRMFLTDDPFECEDAMKWLERCPSLYDSIPWDRLDGVFVAIILKKHPEFVQRCPLDNMSGYDWVDLLLEQPQFADRCSWDKFIGVNWRCLLIDLPQFARYCDWPKLEVEDWCELIRAQPQFSDECPTEARNGHYWAGRLSACPKCVCDCSWGKLDGNDWSYLLERQPCFAEHCKWESLDGKDWKSLLLRQPQFSDRCAWNRLSGWDWRELLCRQPQFDDRCDWAILSVWDWSALLRERPELLERCPHECRNGHYWAGVMSQGNRDECPWGLLDGEDWHALLFGGSHRFIEFCPWYKPLDKVSSVTYGCEDGYRLPLAIIHRPELMDDQEIVSSFTGLLETEEGFFKDDFRSALLFVDDRLGGVRVNPWAFVLYYRPELGNMCRDYEKFNGYSRCVLLMRQPQFAEKWSLDELAIPTSACWRNLSEGDYYGAWHLLVSAQPQFAKWRINK